jgi:hypothetical protein
MVNKRLADIEGSAVPAAMTLKRASVWLGATAATFVACCLLMVRFGHEMDAQAVVYPFMVVWGISALAWPLFAIWTFKAGIASLKLRMHPRW